MIKVYIVGISEQDDYVIFHVCLKKETALSRYDEMRNNLIAECNRLIARDQGTPFESRVNTWTEYLKMLQEIKPGEKGGFFEYPYFEEKELEEN